MTWREPDNMYKEIVVFKSNSCLFSYNSIWLCWKSHRVALNRCCGQCVRQVNWHGLRTDWNDPGKRRIFHVHGHHGRKRLHAIRSYRHPERMGLQSSQRRNGFARTRMGQWQLLGCSAVWWRRNQLQQQAARPCVCCCQDSLYCII